MFVYFKLAYAFQNSPSARSPVFVPDDGTIVVAKVTRFAQISQSSPNLIMRTTDHGNPPPGRCRYRSVIAQWIGSVGDT